MNCKECNKGFITELGPFGLEDSRDKVLTKKFCSNVMCDYNIETITNT